MSRNVRYELSINNKDGSGGMSLIELMVVMIIIGIMVMLVYPNYQEHILRSRRNECTTQLLQMTLRQESYRLKHIRYAAADDLGMPINDYYTFSVVNSSATSYTLIAQAKGAQTADSHCQTLVIDQSMNKTPSHCW